ncbi:MAG: YicC family protein [bacterium]|nr:YicC family protein [bacterium]
MIASMTGFGKGETEAGEYRASVEVRSVNGRYGDVVVHISRSLSELESRIKSAVLETVSRGRVDVSVNVEGQQTEQGRPVLNLDVVDAYGEVLAVLKERLQLSGEADLAAVVTLPHLFNFESQGLDLDAVWEAIAPAIQEAVSGCLNMRKAEGKKLAEDFVARIGILEDLLQQVEALAPERVVTIRQKLEDKLAMLLTPEQVDENRLLMEISILAERSDVTEECVRFYSHNAQFLETMKRNEAVGRRLNFLLQEMLREANTIGSKAGDAEIAHLVVEMKEEIEKLKEQVQNIE